ncbi:LOW QUALITY PROTEIN: SH3 domain and tetratricopeptide repeat-containing protein 2 [Dryobates pubescens]|uniref:LOW QUALITY PROTEIN: SH3 domain and tetratricopeptide repeat-containing protein 2 n=1 Tax=Dryobates pubescens TaxID=118200 RepID=UPI0023B9FB12|nr:LOW QUALITY PROTEIN: SH3 domain and tetratricopeptide repeat-containing protein 2 [Dryobates pubescens]
MQRGQAGAEQSPQRGVPAGSLAGSLAGPCFLQSRGEGRRLCWEAEVPKMISHSRKKFLSPCEGVAVPGTLARPANTVPIAPAWLAEGAGQKALCALWPGLSRGAAGQQAVCSPCQCSSSPTARGGGAAGHMGCCLGTPWHQDLSLGCTGEECDSCCRRSFVLLPRWDYLQQPTAKHQGKWWQEKTMASGKAGASAPSSPTAEAAEGSPDSSSVLLAVGEGFPAEISLFFSVESRSSHCLNSHLQEAARKKMWALESDDRDVCALFKELSARLVCMQAQEDRFLLTFKTLEEVWKFSTYLTLGYVGSCLEQLLFDQEYWLNCALMEDTEIRVTVDEDHLATIYMGLLLQEGNFFSRAVPGVWQLEQEGKEGLQLCRNELIHVKKAGEESKWEGMSLLTGQRGLVPVAALEPLPHPFYQWFLKTYAVNFGISHEISGMTSQPIVKGRCRATEDHRAAAWDELSFSKGDSIEVIGFFVPGLPWFVGKSLSSGNIGFVPTQHMSPEACEPLGKGLAFLSEEEKCPLLRIPCGGGEQHFTSLLGELARTDITSVYRLDGFEPTARLPKVPSEAVLRGCKDIQLLQSWEEINDLATTSTSELSSPGSESAPATLEDVLLEKLDDFDDPKFFIDLNAGHMEDADVFDPILTFLNQDSYVPSYQSLYDLSFSFLNSTFYGFSDEDELVLYLETSRNWAKRTHSVWAHVRLCFLLGKLCIKKVKFSQARVYFEEALSHLHRGFGDLPLLAALHVNLASIYLKQNMKHKFSSLLGKMVALLVCLPGHSFSSENELEVMMYILREAIAVGNAPLEARVCFLVVKLFLQLGKTDEVLPFAEHLQCLTTAAVSPDTSSASLDATPILSYLYDKKYLPNIALASARLFVPSGVKGVPTPIWRAGFILQSSSKLLGGQLDRSSIPPLACFYLKQALHFSCRSRAVPIQRTLCAILSKLYLQHGVLDGAVGYAATALTLGRLMGEEEAFESSLSLGWMYLLHSQPSPAADILWQLLHSLHRTDSVTQGGAVHNLLAIALKGEGQVQKAAENYLRALHKAKETGNKRNQAISLANLGQLSLSRGASQLSELYLLQSTQLYAELQGTEDLEMELVWVLLWLAQAMVNRQRIEDGKLCYELALGFALKWHNVRSQLHITESLCHFYSKVSPNLQACITYHEHWVSLAQQLHDREMEGNVQQTLSQLYQALGTSEALRQSLDCTKQSLRIFIDFEETVKAAEAWLQAGKLYYLMQEDELVEMYFQAAIQTALKWENFSLAMDLYEKAGDTFFNGSRNRDRAVEFYRGGAVPLARKLKATRTELRLFSKLAELQIGLQGYEKALEFATLAARLSIRVGDQLQELVAFHRLATVYYFLHMYEMAEDCYLKTLALRPPLLQCSGEALYYCKVYCHLGNMTLHKLKDEQDAAAYFLLALAAATELGDQELQGLIRAKLGAIPSAPPGCATYRPRWLSEGGHVV